MTPPPHIRRATYETPAPQDAFIVLLLRDRIEFLLSNYAQPSTTNAKVLDVGCGQQPFRQQLEKLGYKYISLDATQNLEQSVDLVYPIDQPLPDTIGQNEGFNLIFCTEVLEHVADWPMAFQNFAQLLAPGGRLLITCPHFFRLHEEPHDFWRPTPYALRHFAHQAGLFNVYQENAGTAWDVLGILLPNCWTFPTSKRWRDRIVTKLTSWGREALFELLQRGWLQQHVHLKGPLYLSNIAVFERSGANIENNLGG